ncbi:uncharacterized protein PRCAT00003451001 [Priceomyces carsonii]|uniref:uncharacterized protein n=1 Tax=Priceomyces carsonii TaxID=28549 RepID=UPI002ED996AE|nr:unnamed protein product [Priceomyces carsonii]
MTEDFPKAPPQPSEVTENPEKLKDVDDRVSFDNLSKRWTFELMKDGNPHEYYFSFEENRWLENKTHSKDGSQPQKRTLEDADIERQEEENKTSLKRLRKEKLQKMREEIYRLKSQKKEINSLRNNGDDTLTTSGVFVSNLPSDVTKDELYQAFNRFGMISEDYKTGEPRIKLYYENGVFKKEALIIYHSKESVPLAVEMLDNTLFQATSKENIHVQPAQFNNSKKDNDKNSEKKVLTAEEKQLLLRKKDAMLKKLSTWDEDEISTVDHSLDLIKRKIYDKIVVIRNMFRIDELKEDPLLEIDLKEDIQEDCDRQGIGNDITKVVLYDISGVVTVKFKTRELSLKCVEAFNGRFFDGLKLEVSLYNGEKFEMSKSNTGHEPERE